MCHSYDGAVTGIPGRMSISAVDYHTAGEPFRIVSGVVPPLRGARILDKRAYARDNLDHVRQLLINEPRGHADMYGGFVTDPEDERADIGVVFFHNAGYSTACGHGTIALVTWALETGYLPVAEGIVSVVVDVPSGRLRTEARVDRGRVRSVRFVNIPSFVHRDDLEVDSSQGRVRAPVSFGGAFYASVDVGDLGWVVDRTYLPALIDLGREIKGLIEKEHDVVHPLEPDLRDIYGVIFYEDHGVRDGALRQRNVTVFADGEVDRSPCGSGTSARLALLDRSGELPRGTALSHGSIVGTDFRGEVVGDADVAGTPAVITAVEGRAHLIAYHHFVLDPDDEVGTGFLLR